MSGQQGDDETQQSEAAGVPEPFGELVPVPLSEDETPGTAPVYRVEHDAEKHTQQTQRWMAFGVIGVLCLLYGYIVVAFIYGWIDNAQLDSVFAALAGLQAIGAAAAGFYYGTSSRRG